MANRCTGLKQLLACLLVSWLGMSSSLAQERKVVRIATEGAYPPFNYIDNNEPQGFEIDLAKAFCEAMAVTCTFVIHEWDGIIKGLIANEYDAIMSSLAITERRKERIAFSKRYYFIPPAFIGQKDTHIVDVSPESLAGRTIGTIEGSHHAAFLEAHYPRSVIRPYAKLEEADLDLLTRRIDLVLGDKLALSRFLKSKQGACCRFVGEPKPDPAQYGEGVAVGLRKSDKDLKEMFNRAIDKVMADGTYERIRAKYFDFDTK